MRRATWSLLLALVCCMGFPVSRAHAAAQKVDLVNGIGLIDYSHRQHFKPGTWVKYRITGSSEAGMTDDYTVTVLIAGEEIFWGEDCFWVETWTEPKGASVRTVATLMSYSIFDDSLPLPHMQTYTRKLITDVDPDGKPVETVTKRPANSFKSRQPPLAEPLKVVYDTLGVDTVQTPHGTFPVRKIAIKQGLAATSDIADSTMRTEVREDRLTYMTDRVPVTSLAREDIESAIERRSWKLGHSQEAITKVMDHARGVARLIDFGEGLKPQLVPAVFRSTIQERETVARPRGKTRPKSTHGKNG